MSGLLSMLTGMGNLLAAPFGDHAAWALAVWAAVFGALAILAFKLSTRQRLLAAARDRLVGRLIESLLYQQSLRALLRVQGALLVANLRYLTLALPALVTLIVPLVLVLPQVEARLGRRPLAVGESFLVSAAVAPPVEPSLTVTPGLVVEAGPVTDRTRGEVVWRVRAEATGRHQLTWIGGGGATSSLPVTVGEIGLEALPAARHGSGLTQLVLEPTAAPLGESGGISRIAAELPARRVAILGLEAHWLVGFTVLSLLAGLALKRPLRVEL